MLRCEVVVHLERLFERHYLDRRLHMPKSVTSGPAHSIYGRPRLAGRLECFCVTQPQLTDLLVVAVTACPTPTVGMGAYMCRLVRLAWRPWNDVLIGVLKGVDIEKWHRHTIRDKYRGYGY